MLSVVEFTDSITWQHLACLVHWSTALNVLLGRDGDLDCTNDSTVLHDKGCKIELETWRCSGLAAIGFKFEFNNSMTVWFQLESTVGGWDLLETIAVGIKDSTTRQQYVHW